VGRNDGRILNFVGFKEGGGFCYLGRHTAAPIWVSESGNEKSGATVFGNQDAIAQRSSPVLVSTRANRHTLEHAAAAPAGENDASVPIRLLIPTPAQRVSPIGAETDVLQR